MLKKIINNRIIMIVISIILVSIAMITSTYAVFFHENYASNPSSYTTGLLKIEAKSKTDVISLQSALPQTDEDGLKNDPYIFTISNVGNLDCQFNVKLLSTASASTTINPQYIKLQIDNGKSTTLSSLSGGVIKENIILSAGESIDISIRTWLSLNTPNTEIGKVFTSKIVTDGQVAPDISDDYTIITAKNGTATSNFLNTNIVKNTIETITIASNNIVPTDAIRSYDISANNNGKVMLWYKDADKNGKYEVYMGSEVGIIYGNKNSRDLFKNLTNLTKIDNLSKFNTKNVTNMTQMFYGCSNLTSLDVSRFNTQNVTTMYSVFNGCRSLTNLDVSRFNTKNVTDMKQMFYGCSNLTSLDVSRFNTENVTTMFNMFAGCSGLTSLNVSSFNTQNVEDMSQMFSDCSNLTSLDLSSFNTQSVKTMLYMFKNCSSFTSLDLSSFNTKNVTKMSSMFYGCSNLTSLDVSSFNTQKVTDMSHMFNGCRKLTSLDLSSFNTENVTTMYYMFYDCRGLKSIDMRNFTFKTGLNSSSMFSIVSTSVALTLNSAGASWMRSNFSSYKNITIV